MCKIGTSDSECPIRYLEQLSILFSVCEVLCSFRVDPFVFPVFIHTETDQEKLAELCIPEYVVERYLVAVNHF